MARLVKFGLPDLIPMVRSDGKHVSHAIRKLAIQFGHFEDSPFPEDKTRMELGSAFEDALARALAERIAASEPGRYIRMWELELDGIYGTPDLFDTVDSKVIEVKLTWLSIKHAPDSKKFWKYWKQLQAYCHMLGVKKGEIWICHIMGNYRYDDTLCEWCGKVGSGPHLHVWEPDNGEFHDSELIDTWAMIKANA